MRQNFTMNILNFLVALFVGCSLTVNAQQLSFEVKAKTAYSQTPYGNNPLVGKFAKTNDANIYYEVYGKGQPIVLLHGGIMGSMDEMTDFIEHLKEAYQVIVVGTRGHGKSEIGHSQLTMDLKANDVLTVINEVTKEPVTVIGFSDGAYTAYQLASAHPSRIKKMIAIGAGEQAPGLRKVVFSGEAFDLKNNFWVKRMELMPEPSRIQEFWSSMEMMYNSLVADKTLFNSIQCPVLLMAGEKDKNALLPSVISAYQMIPNSQLSIIPNTGHVVFMENFPAVWTSIVPFLNN